MQSQYPNILYPGYVIHHVVITFINPSLFCVYLEIYSGYFLGGH